MADKIKLAFALLLVAAGVAVYHIEADANALLRAGVVVLGLALGAGVAWTTEAGRQFVGFSRESVAETRKVAWPDRKETIQTTVVVGLLVAFVAVFLAVVDGTLGWAMNLLMNRGN